MNKSLPRPPFLSASLPLLLAYRTRWSLTFCFRFVFLPSFAFALIPSRSICQMLANFFPELNSKGLYLSSEQEKLNRCLVFTSFIKREKKNFYVIVVQWRQRNVQRSMLPGKVVVLLHKPIAFLTFSLPSPLSLLKLPMKPSLKQQRWAHGHFSCHSKWLNWPFIVFIRSPGLESLFLRSTNEKE